MQKMDLKRYRWSLLLRWLLKMVTGLAAIMLLVGWMILPAVTGGSLDSLEYLLFGAAGYVLLSAFQSKLIFLPEGCSVLRCLRDDALLRRAWNEEHDERRLFICQKAGVPLIPVLSLVLSCAGLALTLVDRRSGAGVLCACLVFNQISTIMYLIWERRLSKEEESNES